MALVRARSRSGQTTVEYILLISIILTGASLVYKGLEKLNLSSRFKKPISGEFARAYRYGHPQAKGYEDGEDYNSGGPDMHPRIDGGNNFRIFFNPRQ